MELPIGSELTLVGVVHRDPLGKERILSLLNQLECDCISLEVSEYALKWRRENGKRLQEKVKHFAKAISKMNGQSTRKVLSHGEIKGVLETLRLPFEFMAAKAYKDSTGAPFHALDDSSVSERLLEKVEIEMITEENITALTSRPNFDYQSSIENIYEECSRILTTEPVPRYKLGLSDENIAINEKRDELMAKQLFQLMSDVPGHWVHICGFTHMIRSDGFQNMASLFPKAKRILAIDLPKRVRKNLAES